MVSKNKKRTKRKKIARSSLKKGRLAFLTVSPEWQWLLLLTVGVILMLVSGIYLIYRQTILSFGASPTAITQINRAARPVKVSFLDQEVNIDEAEITNGIWQTSEISASHLNVSANPGELGNIIIYGHNKWGLFRGLHSLELGNKISVESADGKVHQYLVQEILNVTPNNINVVSPTDFEILTLYTCTGFFDTRRLVIRATPNS